MNLYSSSNLIEVLIVCDDESCGRLNLTTSSMKMRICSRYIGESICSVIYCDVTPVIANL